MFHHRIQERTEHRRTNRMETINEVHYRETRLVAHRALVMDFVEILVIIQIILEMVERTVAVKNVHCAIARKLHKVSTQC